MPKIRAGGKKIKRIRHMLGAALVFLVAGTIFPPATAQTTDQQPDPRAREFLPYEDQFGTVVRLSNEENYPFRFYGRTLAQVENDGGHRRAREFAPVLEEYPSVLSCLKPDQQRETRPDLSQVDWRKINFILAAEVCVFRIAASYQSVEGFERWLEGQGFRMMGRTARSGPHNLGWVTLEAGRSTKEQGRLFDYGWVDWLLERLFGLHLAETIQIIFDPNGQWVDINLSVTRN
ncbi:hypothetical protein [Amaricoccus tamworthensis]|uniref:hypothetical protein n=1 Tax=Amaricoccus tamworthensis TaxID=57002 RepID=UPI003C7DC07A